MRFRDHNPRRRHWPLPRVALSTALALAAVSVCAATPVCAATRQAELGERVAKLLVSRAAAEFPDAEITATTVPLDPRLRLAPCEQLDLDPRGTQRHGRIPVALRCLAPQPWSVFVTAEVNVILPVLVAARPLARGQLVSAEDVQLLPTDLTRVRREFLTDMNDAVGAQVTRALPARAVIYPALLKPPLAVRKGDRVTLLAQRGSVSIQVRGEALRDGMVGAQIPVRNGQSERTVYGWIRGPGVVATHPTAAQ